MSSIRIITCESPEQYIWEEYLVLENEVATRVLLKEKYQNMEIPNPERVAFKNAHPFICYIKQARSIFQTFHRNSLWVQPLLLYYGTMALFKAFVLTKEIDYPQNTFVLRHGLSTRKRKKQSYQFFKDQIRVQRDGLFPLVAKILQCPVLSGESFTAEELFSVIPELQVRYQQFFSTPSLTPVNIDKEYTDQGMRFFIQERVLNQLHLSPNSLVEKLNAQVGYPLFSLDVSVSMDKNIYLLWKHPEISHVQKWHQGFGHPWFFENIKGDFYLWINHAHHSTPPCEILAQYMLLFALGMLCRYEATLWGEMICSYIPEEMVLIQQFLSITKRKLPHLVLNQLREEKTILLVR
jgi:hypothetical protein